MCTMSVNYQLTALSLVTSIYGTCAACVPAASSFRLNDIESSHSLLREHVHVPPAPVASCGRRGFLILGSGGSSGRPGSVGASQAAI